MPKCNKIRNPCKICLGQVSEKTGIQCQGACQTWVHFDCLNYTPGKIKDIKAGIIKVTCPCPDCKTTLPKEYRTDEPFSCNNIKCPANMPPKCGNMACPINKGNPNREYAQTATGCAIEKCGKSCKPNSNPHMENCPQPPPITPCEPPNHPFGYSTQSSDNCIDFNACPSGCASSHDIPGDIGNKGAPITSMGALEQMCNTVGQLTNQINNLMVKMKQVVQDNNGCSTQKGCPQNGPRSLCPKPCYCPGNPGRR